jgi:hypothetical protein
MRSRGQSGVMERTRDDSAGVRERRYIYGGEHLASNVPISPRSNKRVSRRKINVSTFLLTLGIVAVGIILYINNILAVNQLVKETAELQATYDQLLSTNAKLEADKTRESSVEKIGAKAAQLLGMQGTADTIGEFSVDLDALEKAEAIEQMWQGQQHQTKGKR